MGGLFNLVTLPPPQNPTSRHSQITMSSFVVLEEVGGFGRGIKHLFIVTMLVMCMRDQSDSASELFE